jgi:hypothetical protein
MMAKHYKRDAESEFGVGVCYFEIENGWIVRQAENYGEQWRWGDEKHPEWLADQPESELGLDQATTIDASEFEAAWQEARKAWRPGS